MAIQTIDLTPNQGDRLSARVRNFTFVETVTDFTDSGDGYAYSSVFDLREIPKGAWTLYIIPDSGDAVYLINTTYELDPNGEPDLDKALTRQTDATVSAPDHDDVTFTEAIPFLIVGFNAGTTTANSVKLILSAVL